MNKRRLIWIMLLLSVVWASYYNMTSSKLIQTMTSYALYPVLVMQHTIVDPIRTWITQRYTHHELVTLLAQRQRAFEKAMEENVTLRAQLHYATDIQDVQEFKQRYTNQVCLAQVLVRHFSERAQFFLINAGSNKGVERDMTVVYNNYLVGRIVEVYPWYSKVSLITDRTCKVAAYCSETKSQGIHEGRSNEEDTLLKHVSHLAPLKVGDMIISSGEGLVFPQGFALGTIESVYPDGLYQKVHVKPLCDFRSMRYCHVLAKGFVKKEPEMVQSAESANKNAS